MSRCLYVAVFVLAIAGASPAATARVRITFYQLGSVDVLLDANTPQTTDNFLSYVDAGSYAGSIMDRSDNKSGQMVLQGGNYVATPTTLDPILQTYGTASFEGALGLSNNTYTLGAATAAAKSPAGSGWYFNMANNTDFNGNYTAFGTVINGSAVLDEIYGLQTYNFNVPQLATVPMMPSFNPKYFPQVTDWVLVSAAYRISIPGDINGDGLVDVADYNIWAANVGKTNATWSQGDLNGDGLVDVADYNIWAANVGMTASAPQPATIALLAFGGLFLARRKAGRLPATRKLER
jgi:cyclophilin family peptidyl-prolyl cis-trans isomerase